MKLVPLLISSKQAAVLPISNGYCLVSPEDWSWASQFCWAPLKRVHPKTGAIHVYARRNEYLGGGRKNSMRKHVLMHRELLDAPAEAVVDHINHNGLDNRRSNIHLVSLSENAQNQNKKTGCSSQYVGVSFQKRRKMWMAHIKLDGKRIHVGYFHDEKQAAIARDFKAKEIFTNAKLNIPNYIGPCPQPDKKPQYSKYTGVSYQKEYGKWQAYFTTNRKMHHLGFYDTEEEAWKARKLGVEMKEQAA